MNFKDYCENLLNESKESRDLMRKMHLVYIGYGVYKDQQGNKYEYDPRIKQMKKLSLDTKVKYSDKVIDKNQGREAKNNKDTMEIKSKYEAKNSVAYSQGYDSARQIEKFKSKDDAGKAATFFVRKYGYSQKPGEAADFIQGFMDYYNSQHESLNETLESLNNKNNIQKDLNAAMIKLSHLKKEMYKASPGLRDTYQGEIDNLKSYINNLKQKLKES